MTPEGRVKKRFTDKLKAMRDVWYYYPAANGMGRAGIPDIIVVACGRFIGVECKADITKKPTKLQMHCADKIMRAGGDWFLVYDDVSADVVCKYIETLTCY